jgi:hypothetical protein
VSRGNPLTIGAVYSQASRGVGLEPVGTGMKRFRQAPTVGNPTQGVGVVAIKPPAY